MAVSISPALFASQIASVAIASIAAQGALSLCCINTSLSGRCFFRRVGVFRMQCISIPECTQRISHLTTSEGTMAKKAKKAKKAKSAVKKTAKKTRKVAKKKK
jgi:hypothetical protein